MNSRESVVGRKITGVEFARDYDYGGYERGDTLLIGLDNGTVLRVKGHSYEEVDLDYDTVRRQELIRERVGAQHRQWLKRLQHEQARVRKERIVAAKKAALTKEEFKVWYEMAYGMKGTMKVISDVYVKEIAASLRAQSLLLNRTHYENDRRLKPLE